MTQLVTLFKAHKFKSILFLILCVTYYFSLPNPLFNNPTTTVITGSDSKLLGAQIAHDGQWRFPHNDSVPIKFKACILAFEDAYFYKHPGVNPISIFKAFKQNIKAGKVKRGGSTITQQVIRLSRKNTKRTYFEKGIEMILATRLELRCSKEKILSYYTCNAPFGGNVVGLEAAAWRYFNQKASDLSWAQTATLAVLPNAPSLIYPGKNQLRLLKKRNKLLLKLLNTSVIDSLTYGLAISEKLPLKPFRLPQLAPHVLQKINETHSGKYVKTTINTTYQKRTNTIVKQHYNVLKQNEIYNIAVLILDVETRNVLSYVGNSPTNKNHQKDVNIIDKPRSTGSILKPFLYTAMLDAGILLPKQLVPDVPTQYGSYAPENYNKTFAGAVSANLALSRSLNVPAVRMLKRFGIAQFHAILKKMKLQNINKPPSHYGLSLILGGAESNLWDLCKSYAALSATLNNYTKTSSEYFTNEFCEPNIFANKTLNFGNRILKKPLFDAGSIYLTYESLKQVNRPDTEGGWTFFNTSKDIAWKTGTSFGFRDAWAIGTTKKYVVGVWVGNADGEGRPGLVGVQTAAPILFDVFNMLPKTNWFKTPFDALKQVKICNESGYKASAICVNSSIEFIPNNSSKTKGCPYHKRIHLDRNLQYQVNTSCEYVDNIQTKSWFELPPLMAYYYKIKHPFYKPLPPFKVNCNTGTKTTMQFIYPKSNAIVYLPKGFSSIKNDLILKIAHTKPQVKIYWYLDSKYIGTTQTKHEMAIQPTSGTYLITALDELGNTIKRLITISL